MNRKGNEDLIIQKKWWSAIFAINEEACEKKTLI